MNILKNISLFVFLVIFVACKNEAPKNDIILPSGNETSALKNTGAIDVSGLYVLDQFQNIPEESCAFNFKSQNVFRMYIRSKDENKQVIFQNNEVFAIFADTTSFQTNFKVDGYDSKGENTIVSVITIKTDKRMNVYRPSFVVTIPKKDVKGLPIISLNGVQLPVTAME